MQFFGAELSHLEVDGKEAFGGADEVVRFGIDDDDSVFGTIPAEVGGWDGIPLMISSRASARCSMTCARAASAVIGLMGALWRASLIARNLAEGGMTFIKISMRLRSRLLDWDGETVRNSAHL